MAVVVRDLPVISTGQVTLTQGQRRVTGSGLASAWRVGETHLFGHGWMFRAMSNDGFGIGPELRIQRVVNAEQFDLYDPWPLPTQTVPYRIFAAGPLSQAIGIGSLQSLAAEIDRKTPEPTHRLRIGQGQYASASDALTAANAIVAQNLATAFVEIEIMPAAAAPPLPSNIKGLAPLGRIGFVAADPHQCRVDAPASDILLPNVFSMCRVGVNLHPRNGGYLFDGDNGEGHWLSYCHFYSNPPSGLATDARGMGRTGLYRNHGNAWRVVIIENNLIDCDVTDSATNAGGELIQPPSYAGTPRHVIDLRWTGGSVADRDVWLGDFNDALYLNHPQSAIVSAVNLAGVNFFPAVLRGGAAGGAALARIVKENGVGGGQASMFVPPGHYRDGVFEAVGDAFVSLMDFAATRKSSGGSIKRHFDGVQMTLPSADRFTLWNGNSGTPARQAEIVELVNGELLLRKQGHGGPGAALTVAREAVSGNFTRSVSLIPETAPSAQPGFSGLAWMNADGSVIRVALIRANGRFEVARMTSANNFVGPPVVAEVAGAHRNRWDFRLRREAGDVIVLDLLADGVWVEELARETLAGITHIGPCVSSEGVGAAIRVRDWF